MTEHCTLVNAHPELDPLRWRDETGSPAAYFPHSLLAMPTASGFEADVCHAIVTRRKYIPAMKARAYEEALALHRRGHLAQAELLYAEVLRTQPDHPDALHMLGVVAVQSGKVQAGMELIHRSLRINPNQPAAHASLGNALRVLKRPAEALVHYDQALALDPEHSTALNNRGSALLDLQRLQEALASYDRALQLKPDHLGTLCNRGNALLRLKRTEEALTSYERALQVKPDFMPALCARGNALLGLQRPADALACFDRALGLDPNQADALAGRGKSLRDLRRLEEALDSLDRCLTLNPHSFEAHHNRGSVLLELQRQEAALLSYDRALQLDPGSTETHYSRGVALAELGRHAEAAGCFARTVGVAPDFPYALGGLLQSRMQLCDWTEWRSSADRVGEAVRSGKRVCIPFAFLGAAESPAAQLLCARVYVADTFPPIAPSGWTGQRYEQGRIRVAYLSADFRDHPVSQLLAGVLERQDRERFESIAVSLRPPDGSVLGSRIAAAAGKFLDVSRQSDGAVTELLRRLQIDIAVDLQGFTHGMRPGIFARRAAPVQANYLGFPATMGAEYIDYIIADGVVIPAAAESDYAERIVRLPHCYLPCDNRQPIAARTPSRAEAGLPAKAFVFCAFNNPYKITPAMFDIWMRLLRATPASILWLRSAAAAVMTNLGREAAARGVAPERLVFAPQVAALEDHLARHRLADLFLDTLPYNAHATAVNALWAGLPVLTCLGTAFPGRVGASLLQAAGLPELIAHDLSEYERLALHLANDPQALAAIRGKLASNLLTQPLFDTDRFCRHLESAFIQMTERQRRGEPPVSICVAAME